MFRDRGKHVLQTYAAPAFRLGRSFSLRLNGRCSDCGLPYAPKLLSDAALQFFDFALAIAQFLGLGWALPEPLSALCLLSDRFCILPGCRSYIPEVRLRIPGQLPDVRRPF
jgi:hypothetical protein